nr:MAG TPA: hypothetical protein [Bacteriophage sp.]
MYNILATGKNNIKVHMCNLFWVSTHKNFKRRNDL